ncbi:hypothetical protein [Alkanindiges illinoisensis]|uniref:hypothetical protein n=1 Tax=Alkanindiges illinoisensis TaxID=197183 RepID=UPI0012EB0BE0|nr:hypothetical protein [Alkanindiges illinoisensis]
MIKPRLIYLSSMGLLLGSTLFSSLGYAATELSDRALRHETEANPAQANVADVLDCPKDMREAECTRLQYERYANQTDRSYNEFLKNETTNPLRNRVIKQPLLTQPLDNPSAPAEPRPNLNNMLNQLKTLPDRLPPTSIGTQP